MPRSKAGGWVDAMRELVPEPEKLYTWWSYRSPDWKTADKGRRLDHMWLSPALLDRISAASRSPRKRAAGKPFGSCAGHGDAGTSEPRLLLARVAAHDRA